MANRPLHNIQPTYASTEATIDPSWERVGVTDDGRVLYRERYPTARAVPLVNEETGEREYRHSPTGEKLIAKNRPEFYEHDQVFYLENPGNTNVRKVAYTPATEEERLRSIRRRRAAELQSEFFEALVESGADPEQIISNLRAGVLTPPTADDSGENLHPPNGEPEFPVHYAPGRWRLSDGSEIQGKKIDALAAQAQIDGKAPEY